MKITVFIDKNHPEEVVIHAHERTKLVDSIEQLVADSAEVLVGYKDKEMVRLTLGEVCCFIVEDGKIYALTQSDKLQLKCRLYSLEERLFDSFIKINKSCIANLKMVERFDASFSGSLQVKFKNGYVDYVSRRNVRGVKERLGL